MNVTKMHFCKKKYNSNIAKITIKRENTVFVD